MCLQKHPFSLASQITSGSVSLLQLRLCPWCTPAPKSQLYALVLGCCVSPPCSTRACKEQNAVPQCLQGTANVGSGEAGLLSILLTQLLVYCTSPFLLPNWRLQLCARLLCQLQQLGGLLQRCFRGLHSAHEALRFALRVVQKEDAEMPRLRWTSSSAHAVPWDG